MDINEENGKVKIRIKFKSGEEFEAEGSPDFIEKQRADFLQLIGKDSRRTGRAAATHTPTAEPTAAQEISAEAAPSPAYPAENQPTTPSFEPAAPPYPSDEQMQTPAVLRTESSSINRGGQAAALPRAARLSADTTSFADYPTRSWPTINTAPTPTISQGISAAERAALRAEEKRAEHTDDMRLWEELVRVEDEKVFLRRKSRLLTPDTAALILLAAAKMLLHLPDGYSALALAKSLKKSGYGGERLDRVLGGELRRGTVRSEGQKRARFYFLSDEGFAKAYVLAGKLLEERR